MASIESELQTATARIGSHSARLDAEVLLSHCLKKPRSHLFAWPEKVLEPDIQQHFEQLVEQRITGQPISYLTGQREFWSADLNVSSDVLIPRPETELLVETALKKITGNNLQIADLGTGSGAIAIALATERPNWCITATDISQPALDIASKNAIQNKITSVTFRSGAWCRALEAKEFDLIISNPPYIPASDPHLKEGDVRFEPRQALVSGENGLKDIRNIISQSKQHLKNGAWLMLEHGYNQANDVASLFSKEHYQQIETVSDLAGHARVSLGQWKAKGP